MLNRILCVTRTHAASCSGRMSRSDEGQPELVDVVVVGGGLAGLNTARHLAKYGITRVAVLEARDRLGGRTFTESFDGVWVDQGAGYIGPAQDRLLELAKEFQIKSYKVNTAGSSVMRLNGTISSYHGIIPSVPAFKLLDLNSLIVKSDSLSSEIDLVSPWNSPDAKLLDSVSVAEWVDRQAWTADAKGLYHMAVRAVLATEATEVSMLFWLWYTKGAHGFVRMTECENGAQERKFYGGTQQVAEGLGKLLKEAGIRVILSAPVRSITTLGPRQVRVVSDRGAFIAKHVVLAFAPALLEKIAFSPPLPGVKVQLAQRMPMGSMIKAGHSGLMISDSGPVLTTFDDCKPDETAFALMGFVISRDWLHRTPAERERAICQQYSEVFKDERYLHPVRYVEKSWIEEEWSRGCYVGVMPAGVVTQFGPHLRTAVGDLHFAGTETAVDWPGYMEGALQSGERAAHELAQQVAADAGLAAPPPPPAAPPSEEVPARPVTRPTAVERHLPGVPAATALLASLVALAAWAARHHLRHSKPP